MPARPAGPALAGAGQFPEGALIGLLFCFSVAWWLDFLVVVLAFPYPVQNKNW